MQAKVTWPYAISAVALKCSHVFYPSARAFVVEPDLLSQFYLKCQDDVRSVSPKCQVSDESTVFRLVSRFSGAVHKVVVTFGRVCTCIA